MFGHFTTLCMKGLKTIQLMVIKRHWVKLGSLIMIILMMWCSVAYSKFIQKLMEVIEKVAIAKKKIIKMNSRNWFDSEISEKLKTREKTLQKYKNMGFM